MHKIYLTNIRPTRKTRTLWQKWIFSMNKWIKKKNKIQISIIQQTLIVSFTSFVACFYYQMTVFVVGEHYEHKETAKGKLQQFVRKSKDQIISLMRPAKCRASFHSLEEAERNKIIKKQVIKIRAVWNYNRCGGNAFVVLIIQCWWNVETMIENSALSRCGHRDDQDANFCVDCRYGDSVRPALKTSPKTIPWKTVCETCTKWFQRRTSSINGTLIEIQ